MFAARTSRDTVARTRSASTACQSNPVFHDQMPPLPVYSAQRAAAVMVSCRAQARSARSGTRISENASFTVISPLTFGTIENCTPLLTPAKPSGTPRIRWAGLFTGTAT